MTAGGQGLQLPLLCVSSQADAFISLKKHSTVFHLKIIFTENRLVCLCRRLGCVAKLSSFLSYERVEPLFLAMSSAGELGFLIPRHLLLATSIAGLPPPPGVLCSIPDSPQL